jgi:hypothetical protein
MSEWWTYRPSDFLMFSARTWTRLVGSWNEALWPWQGAMVAVALLMMAAAAGDPRRERPWAIAVLAVAWAWVGWAFHWERFADVNTGARWFALAFGVQAALLLALGLRSAGAPPTAMRGVGLALAALALIYPLIAPLSGRGWSQAEVVGAMPEPTALFTIGLLLALPQRHRALLLAIPVLALSVGGTTQWLLWTN